VICSFFGFFWPSESNLMVSICFSLSSPNVSLSRPRFQQSLSRLFFFSCASFRSRAQTLFPFGVSLFTPSTKFFPLLRRTSLLEVCRFDLVFRLSSKSRLSPANFSTPRPRTSFFVKAHDTLLSLGHNNTQTKIRSPRSASLPLAVEPLHSVPSLLSGIFHGCE